MSRTICRTVAGIALPLVVIAVAQSAAAVVLQFNSKNGWSEFLR